MKQSVILSGVFVVACVVSGIAQELKLPYYGANPQAANYSRLCKEMFPNGQPAKVVSPQELDVRSCDISSWNLTEYTAEELADVISFDSRTKFPPKNKLPKRFEATQILQNGKNPGLGVRHLHAQGITGKGVSMAIIDQNLLLGHIEYAPNVVFYEEDPIYAQWGAGASMHGAALVSIAVGKSVGVAPQARIFALAGKFKETNGVFDAQPIANMLRRVDELNTQLPADKKIRVVSISRGFDSRDNGSAEFQTIQNSLEKDGVAVFTTKDVFTLSRNHTLDNPENATNYCRPAYWFEKEDVGFLSEDMTRVIVPTDFRTTSSPTGNNDYVHYANGGLSWAVPYVAGLYALGVQVYPPLTKEIFMQAVQKTATLRHCEYQGKLFSMPLVNPTALINYLKGLKK